MTGSAVFRFDEIVLACNGASVIQRSVPLEVPIAFEFGGLAYSVMLSTPDDIEDFATGFALSEGLIDRADQLKLINIAQVDDGIIVRAQLPDDKAEPLRDRLRIRLNEGSCGLCGLQSIKEVLRPLPLCSGAPNVTSAVLLDAIESISDHQRLSRQTGATHAAAFCSTAGEVIAAREDVGRHNALDKLIGHCARTGLDMSKGFILLTARCSYELVEKTVRAGCSLLVTISGPTALAIERATQSGLTLVTLARSDTALVANDPHGIFA